MSDERKDDQAVRVTGFALKGGIRRATHPVNDRFEIEQGGAIDLDGTIEAPLDAVRDAKPKGFAFFGTRRRPNPASVLPERDGPAN